MNTSLDPPKFVPTLATYPYQLFMRIPSVCTPDYYYDCLCHPSSAPKRIKICASSAATDFPAYFRVCRRGDGGAGPTRQPSPRPSCALEAKRAAKCDLRLRKCKLAESHSMRAASTASAEAPQSPTRDVLSAWHRAFGQPMEVDVDDVSVISSDDDGKLSHLAGNSALSSLEDLALHCHSALLLLDSRSSPLFPGSGGGNPSIPLYRLLLAAWQSVLCVEDDRRTSLFQQRVHKFLYKSFVVMSCTAVCGVWVSTSVITCLMPKNELDTI